MQQIDRSEVRKFSTIGGGVVRAPMVIGTACPYCSEKVILTLAGHTDDPQRLAVAANATCPGCGKVAKFWAMRDAKKPTGDEGNPTAVYMYPAASVRYPYPSLPDEFPAPLRKAITTTIDSFNAGIYTATAVTGRRTLEGIFKYLLPEGKRNQVLAKLIESARTETDLAAPLTALSHAIRDGGNLGAHFDMEREPTEAVARQMVELLDYLISYLYVLPGRIKALESTLSETDV